MNKYLKHFAYLVFIMPVIQGCIDPYDYPYKEETNYLVVEANLTTDPGPHTVSLMTTRNLKNEKNAFPLRMNFATVSIIAGSGLRERLVEKDTSGVYYSSDDFRGKVGEKYVLDVMLKDGRSYLSDSVELIGLPNIDSLGIRYGSERYVSELNSSLERTGFFIDAYMDDPANQENFYKVEWDYTYKVFTHPERSVPPADCCSTCWVEHEAPGFALFDDEINNGDVNAQFPLFFLPVTGKMFYDRIYVVATLQAMSKEAYQFWQTVYSANYSQGGIFDPTPNTVPANMKNVDDPSELVVGYFYAGETKSQVRFIHPSESPERKDYDTGQIGTCLALPNTTIIEPDYWNE